jgi:hypothetical protein
MPGSVLGSPKEPGTDRDVPFKKLTIGTVRGTAEGTVRGTAEGTVPGTAEGTVRGTAEGTVRAQRKAGRLGNGS